MLEKIRYLLAPKSLKQKELQLEIMQSRARETMDWCSFDSPEIGFAMLHLLRPQIGVSQFRDKLRKGEYTFEAFRAEYHNKR